MSDYARGWQWALKLTANGQLFECLEAEVPAVPRQWLDAIVYLYSSEDAARWGDAEGGTGFLVSVGTTVAGMPADAAHLYVVTNAHVIEGGCTYVRVNQRGRGTDVLPLTLANWELHPDGDDVAVASVVIHGDNLRYATVPVELAVAQSDFSEPNPQLAPGDEVLFIGRYVNHEGKEQNQPVVRSGIIAQVWGDPVFQERLSGNRFQESVLVEERSIGGASGSPVFCYRGARIGGLAQFGKPGAVGVIPEVGNPIYLLGVNWGHHRLREAVRNSAGHELSDQQGKPTGEHVRSNSGIAMVVPAWKLRQLINTFARARLEVEVAYVRSRGRSAQVPAGMDVEQGDSGGSPTGELLRRLMQVPKEEADEVHRDHQS